MNSLGIWFEFGLKAVGCKASNRNHDGISDSQDLVCIVLCQSARDLGSSLHVGSSLHFLSLSELERVSNVVTVNKYSSIIFAISFVKMLTDHQLMSLSCNM